MVVLAFIAALTSLVGAVDAGPLAIKTCRIQYVPGNQLTKSTGPLIVTLQNATYADADSVAVEVRFNGRSTMLEDQGTYSPGIPVTHRYHDLEGDLTMYAFARALQPTCRIAYAHFVDGSVWYSAPIPGRVIPPTPLPTSVMPAPK